MLRMGGGGRRGGVDGRREVMSVRGESHRVWLLLIRSGLVLLRILPVLILLVEGVDGGGRARVVNEIGREPRISSSSKVGSFRSSHDFHRRAKGGVLVETKEV